MDRIKTRRYKIGLFLLFMFTYFIILYPMLQPQKEVLDLGYFSLLNIVFLNFNQFELFNLTKLNPQYSIVFILFFYLVYHHQIEDSSENTSFIGLSFHKQTIKEVYIKVIKTCTKRNLILLGWIFGSIVVVEGIRVLIHQSDYVTIEAAIKVSIYIIRYMILVTTFVISLQILGMTSYSHYQPIIPYVMMIGGMMIDYASTSSFVTMANSIQSELLYVIGTTILCIVIMITLYFKLKRSKEKLL